MEPSLPGLLLLLALLALGRRLGGAIMIGLFLALPFGSTALGTVSALGGSSPLIYVAFLLLLLGATVLRRDFVGGLGRNLSQHWTGWAVGALILYVIIGSTFFPRLFAGQTLAIVATSEVFAELPLAPTSGNVTQTGYLVLSALAYFAFAVSLASKPHLEAVRQGFLGWAIINAGLGAIDLAGKSSGIGDLLEPIRTASYVYLIEVEEAGFWRIAGGYSEASSFGSTTLACLAFSFSYWRVSRSRPVLLLTLALLCLLVLSTSSTAYAGFAIVAAVAATSMAISAVRGRLSGPDLLILAFVWLALIVVLSLYLIDERLFDPFVRLFEAMVLNKSTSGSAEERLHWNLIGLQAFADTFGLGVGLGSSRASSWAVAVIAQLGIIGTLLMAVLVAVLLHDMAAPKPQGVDRKILALTSGVRAAALAGLAAGSVSAGYADPGLIFFVALAVVGACRSGELNAAALRTPTFAAARATSVGQAQPHPRHPTVQGEHPMHPHDIAFSRRSVA